MCEPSDIVKTFRAYDLNGDGKISRSELATVMNSCARLSGQALWSSEDLNAIFDAVDQNDDGTIAYEEFFDWVMAADDPDDLTVWAVMEAGFVQSEEEATREREIGEELDEVEIDLSMNLSKAQCVAVLEAFDLDKAEAEGIFVDLVGDLGGEAAGGMVLSEFLNWLGVDVANRADLADIMGAISEAPAEEPEATEEAEAAENVEPAQPGEKTVAIAADALLRFMNKEGKPLEEAVALVQSKEAPLSATEQGALEAMSEDDLAAAIQGFAISPALLCSTAGQLSTKQQCKAAVGAIIERCQAEGVKFTDPGFDLESSPDSCLWVDQEAPGFDCTVERPAGFKRISELCESPCICAGDARANDIVQGSIGTCFLLGAMGAIVGNDKNAVKNIFIQHDFDVGVFGIRFCVEGEWVFIIVDDLMPVTEDGCLLYCSSKDPNEWWAPLLEKAYCKLLTCYEMCDGGRGAEAIFSFFGGVNGSFDIKQTHKESPSHYFKLLKGARQRGLMLTTGFQGGQDHGGRGPCGEPLLPCGLVSGHAYSVLKVAEAEGNMLVCCRNPWGSGEWTGRWGDNNAEGEWTEEMVAATGFQAGEDGTFWMSIEDFVANSSGVDFARSFGPKWKKLTQYGRFQSGGLTATAIADYEAAADDEISFSKGDTVEVEAMQGYWFTGSTADGSSGFCPGEKLKLNHRPVAKFILSGEKGDQKAVVLLMQPNAYMKRKFYTRHEDGMHYKDVNYAPIHLVIRDGEGNVIVQKTDCERSVWADVELPGDGGELTVWAMGEGGTADRFALRVYTRGSSASLKEVPDADFMELQEILGSDE